MLNSLDKNTAWKPNASICKDVCGYEGLYSISCSGLVKSLTREVASSNGKSRTVKGRILKPTTSKNGYPYVSLSKKGTVLKFYVHRLVALNLLPPSEKDFVTHIDGNKKNNKITNLEWVTRQENENHAIRVGLKNDKGEDNPMAKLTEKDIRNIREMLSKGVSMGEISREFNVATNTISRIKNRKRWGWFE